MEKSFQTEFALCFFLGLLGAHRFYTKRYISAIIMLLLTLTGWGLIITVVWWLFDLVICFVWWFGSDEDKQEFKKSLSFTNSCDSKKEYEERKAKKIELATGDFYFWDKLEIPSHETSKEYLKNWICPYCQEKIIERKGRTFKCPHCKQKIFRKKELATKEEGLFSEQQKLEIDTLWDEYHKRIGFLEHYQYIDRIILPQPTLITLGNTIKTKFTEDKKKNMETLIFYLHLGLPDYYKKENLDRLRDCRYFEGIFQEYYGTIQQATNAYMSVLYIDLLGNYNSLFADKDFTKKELKEMGCSEWEDGFIAPAIYDCAFQENLPLEKFKEIFLFNANSLAETLQFKVPISPEKAWKKILEYRESLE